MRRFLKQNMLILVLMNSGNVFNYLFQVIIGRGMSPADFGAFNALNSLMVIFAAPLAIVPLVMARFTARFALEGHGRVRTLFSKGLLTAAAAAAAAYLLGLLALPWLKGFLHFTETAPILLMLAVMAGSFILPVPWGMLQGLQRFLGYGLAGASNALFRCLGGLAWVLYLGLGVNGALLSSLTGIGAALALNLYFLKDVFRAAKTPLPGGLWREVGAYSSVMLLSSVITMAMGNLDLVLVRHFCDAEGAGLYATAAILGRIAFYLPSVLMSVLFTEAASAKEAGRDGLRSLLTSAGMTAALGGGFALFCLFGSELVIRLLFGAQYISAGPLLSVISAAMALLALANIVFVYLQARGEFGFVWLQALGLALFLGLVLYRHDTPLTVAWELFAAIAVMLAGTAGWFLLNARRGLKDKVSA